MCTVKEIQEAIREDCQSQHDMEFIEIDRVMQTLPFAQEGPFDRGASSKAAVSVLCRKCEQKC